MTKGTRKKDGGRKKNEYQEKHGSFKESSEGSSNMNGRNTNNKDDEAF
jgi:hypothetical protein